MADSERRTRGKTLFQQVTQFDQAFEPSDAFTEFTIDAVYGDVWSRDGLTRKERRLLSIAAAATSSIPTETEAHMTGALKSGDITPREMMEVIVHLAHYAGWPKAASMYRMLGPLCAQLDLEAPGPDADA